TFSRKSRFHFIASTMKKVLFLYLMFKFNVEYKINIRKKIDDKIQGIYYFTPSNDAHDSLFNNHDKDQFIEKVMIENIESKSNQFNFLSMNENDPNIKNDKSEFVKKRCIEVDQLNELSINYLIDDNIKNNKKECLVESFNYYLKKDLNQLSLCNNLENLDDHLQKNFDIEIHPLCNNLEIDHYQQKNLANLFNHLWYFIKEFIKDHDITHLKKLRTNAINLGLFYIHQRNVMIGTCTYLLPSAHSPRAPNICDLMESQLNYRLFQNVVRMGYCYKMINESFIAKSRILSKNGLNDEAPIDFSVYILWLKMTGADGF
ncbi:7605_t:CDS:2, partial [Dentiscutata erythropus]